MFIPGVDLNKIVDGRWSLGDAWQYYTVNVKKLETLTHEQFCKENPEAAIEIEKASKILEKWEKIASQFENDA